MHSQAFSSELQGQLEDIRSWLDSRAKELGFGQLRISDTDVSEAVPKLKSWLAEGRHGEMEYMERHASLRAQPEQLQAGAIRSICVTMPYLPQNASQTSEEQFSVELARLQKHKEAVISLYARGRDYHKILRAKLQLLATELEDKIAHVQAHADGLQYRVFTDSAPIMEVELARKAGLGWRGKHTLLLHREFGSFFFLGEILINLPLAVDEPVEAHCGSCQACIDICPTQAITAPYALDARRCISYLTIEHPGSIPVEFRKAMGNRVYGCDDCQLVCPWNKYAQHTSVPDFAERHQLGSATLVELWSWSEVQFNQRHEGSAIRRIGYSRWRRNLAIALGNALASNLDAQSKKEIANQLRDGLQSADPLVAEHVTWALEQAHDPGSHSIAR
jgi:epoxyqueuosine reductase